MEFKHLKYAKQSYLEHFKDSIKYVGLSLKASFYFTVHSIYPDLCEHKGSNTIKKLNDILQKKIQSINESVNII